MISLSSRVIWTVISPGGITTTYNLSPGDDLNILAKMKSVIGLFRIEISTNKGVLKYMSIHCT